MVTEGGRGGATFYDRRYDHVFTYHNGAESYYGVRGFRGSLRVWNPLVTTPVPEIRMTDFFDGLC